MCRYIRFLVLVYGFVGGLVVFSGVFIRVYIVGFVVFLVFVLLFFFSRFVVVVFGGVYEVFYGYIDV